MFEDTTDRDKDQAREVLALGRSRIQVILTYPNGNTRGVSYEVAGDADRATILFNTLKDQAWAASAYARPEPS